MKILDPSAITPFRHFVWSTNTSWWQLKYFWFSTLQGERIQFDLRIFFKLVGSTIYQLEQFWVPFHNLLSKQQWREPTKMLYLHLFFKYVIKQTIWFINKHLISKGGFGWNLHCHVSKHVNTKNHCWDRNNRTAYSHRIHWTGLFTYIYHKNQPKVSKYTVRPMDPFWGFFGDINSVAKIYRNQSHGSNNTPCPKEWESPDALEQHVRQDTWRYVEEWKLDIRFTLPETNIFTPENGWLEDEFPFGRAYLQGYVSFREGISQNLVNLWWSLIRKLMCTERVITCMKQFHERGDYEAR